MRLVLKSGFQLLAVGVFLFLVTGVGRSQERQKPSRVCMYKGEPYSVGAGVNIDGKERYCNTDGSWIDKYPPKLANDIKHRSRPSIVCVNKGRSYSVGARISVKGKDRYCDVDGKWIGHYPKRMARDLERRKRTDKSVPH